MSTQNRVFELRTYTPRPGKRDPLLERLRDPASVLFEKHGMTIIGFWLETDNEGNPGDTIIYLLAHDSLEARIASWKAFVSDPEWVEVKEHGEDITEKIVSQLLTPTEFSYMR